MKCVDEMHIRGFRPISRTTNVDTSMIPWLPPKVEVATTVISFKDKMDQHKANT